jgi:WD40 repeat protein
VKLWDTTTGESGTTLRGHKSWLNAVAFSADGRWLISGSSDGTVAVWRTPPAKLQTTLDVTAVEVRSVAISADGKTIAAGLRYGTLKTWAFDTRREHMSVKAHDGDASALAFAPGGRTLISGGGDWDKPGMVKLWDTATGKPGQSFRASGEVLGVACSADGRIVAAGCGDGTVTAWTLNP